MEKVDVLINVFSKPWQTALSLLSLLRVSGNCIDKIYFHEEPAHFSLERTSHEKLLAFLESRVIYFQPKYWMGVESTQAERLEESDYRLSMRYQYGIENSNKQYVLLIHNDICANKDVVRFLFDEIGEYSGVGQIGQCWWCPAHQHELCSPSTYEAFRPDFSALNRLYAEGFNPLERRAYHYGWGEQFKQQPWPLPECRINEWCMLIDRHKTLPDSQPYGHAVPLGSQFPSGACIGENFDEPVNLDTGVQWFRDLSHCGHRFKHVDIHTHVTHDKMGHSSILNPEMYVARELAAKKQVCAFFPEFMSFFNS